MKTKNLKRVCYKVIANYPKSPFVLNQIIELKHQKSGEFWYEWAEYNGIERENSSFFNEYPNIFKKVKLEGLQVEMNYSGCTKKRHDIELTAWRRIKDVCYNTNHRDYRNYGGRGIKVCERWLNSFDNFLTDMGFKPFINYSIDRINVNGDYEPLNCRWADRGTQQNNRTNSVYIEWQGQNKTISEWAKCLNIKPCTFRYRYKSGLKGNDLFSNKPLKPGKKSNTIF